MNENSMPEQSMDRPVLVIGAAVLDMVGVMKDAPLSGTVNPANIRFSFGGVARNVAENLSRLGQPVYLVTAVGRDHMGKDMLEQTAACGVIVQNSLTSEKFTSASYLAVLDTQGSRYLALEDIGVLTDLTPQYLRQLEGLLVEAALVFVDANLQPESLRAIMELAGRARVPICADTTSELLANRLAPYLGSIRMITANSAEASALCPDCPRVTDQDTALKAARQLVNRGVELAVVTLAELGVVYATSETSGYVPAMRTRIVDPTGAGDALTATVIFGMMNDISIDESVRLGVTAASLILRYRGTVLPGLSLEKLYDELVL